MPLSKQRTISLAVLGLALVGLGVDRFVLGTGAAPKSVAEELLVASTGAVTKVADAVASLVSGPALPNAPVSREAAAVADLAKSLRALGVDRSVLNQLPESFTKPEREAKVEVAVVPTVPIGEPPLVTAVLVGQTPRAIAGGKALRVGSEVDGWRIAHVARGRVIFERDGMRVERQVSRVPALETMAIAE
jgi:hypothetical protein